MGRDGVFGKGTSQKYYSNIRSSFFFYYFAFAVINLIKDSIKVRYTSTP